MPAPPYPPSTRKQVGAALQQAGQYDGGSTVLTSENAKDVGLDSEQGFAAPAAAAPEASTAGPQLTPAQAAALQENPQQRVGSGQIVDPTPPGPNGQTPEKIPGAVLVKPADTTTPKDAGTSNGAKASEGPEHIPGAVLVKPADTAAASKSQESTAPEQIPGATLVTPAQSAQPPAAIVPATAPPPDQPPQSQLPSQFQTPPQPLTIPTPTPESAQPDPQELQQVLVAQGKSPGEAQALANGQQPKTLAGTAPAPKPQVQQPAPLPTPSASDQAIRAQNEQALAQPAAKLPTPVDTLKADEKNRVDPVALYRYLLGKFAKSGLVGYVPPDGERWGIKTGSAAEWAAFGLAVAKQESDLNTRSYNADDPGGSAGLFQFGQGQTQFTSGQDQFNPQASADAFIRSVEHYLANKGSVANLGETFGSIRRPNEAGQYISGAQKVAAGGSGKDLVSSGGGGGEKSAKTSTSSRPVEQPQISLPGGEGSGSQPQSPSGGGYNPSGDFGGGGGARRGGQSEAGNLNFYPGGFGGGGGGGSEEEQAAVPSPSPRYQPQQMQVSAPLPDETQNPVVAALLNRGFSQQQAMQLAQGMQNVAPGKGIGPLNVKGPPPPAPSVTQPKLQFPSAKQLMPGKVPPIVPKKAPPPAAPGKPLQLPGPAAQQTPPPAAPTRTPAVTPAQQAPARQPQQAQAPTPPPGPPKDQPRPTQFTGRPAGSTHGDPNPPGMEELSGNLSQMAKQHAGLLSPDDPRVKKQADGYIKGEHFVEGDPLHDQLLSGLPYGKQGRQRGLLGQAETAIGDKSPMHISYISAPKEAAKFPTKDSRKIQYDEHSPEARLMGTTEGQLVGHSLIPLSVGVKLPSKKGETHDSYIQGISTNILANNFQHTNDKLAAMGRKTPYEKLGAKFYNDLEGYYHNLNAGHTATGRGYAVGTADHPNEPDREHVPYKLSRKEADFIGTVINNTAAFAKHGDAKAIRELARANGTLITEKGETNRLRHDIEQHEPGWRERVLEPSIRSFKTGLIHEIHPSEEHMPETIRPGKEFQQLTKAIARTSERGRPDIPIGASLHHTFADNAKINAIERDFSEHRLSELEARTRLKDLGEDPGDYRFVGGSGGLITPYEDDPEALTPEEHTQMRDNLRKQWVGGKLGVDDYRKKAAEVPLPSRPSKPAAATPAPQPVAEPESEPDTPETPVAAPKPVPKPPKPKPAPKAPPEPVAKPEEAPEEPVEAPGTPPAPDEPLPKVKAVKPAAVKPPVTEVAPAKAAPKLSPDIKKRIGERPLDEEQGKLHDRVAGRLASEIQGAIPLTPDRKATGEFRTDTKGNPLYKKEDYDLSNAPMLGKKALGYDEKGSVNKAPKGTEDKLHPDDLTYLNPTDRLRVSHLHEISATQSYADKISDYYEHVKDHVPAAMNFKDWYNDTEALLKKHFGKDSDLMANLLAATSAGTNVKVNYKLAMQAYHQYKNGDFDRHIDLYRKAHEMKQRGALAQHVLDQGIHNELPKTEAEAMARYLKHHDIVPRQTHGPLFGMNSLPVLKVLAHTWEQEVGGPKTPNYAGNMSGKTLQATADLWVARTMRRLAHEGYNKKPWLIQPPAETGLTNVDFALSQLAYRKAAEKHGLEPRQLQAILWGAEQKHYQSKGWEREIDPADRDYRPSLEKYERPSWVKPSEEEQGPQAQAA